jgi:hypothetical protein
MDNRGVYTKRNKGKFKVSLPELRGLFKETPTNRKDKSQLTSEEFRQQRLEDNKRSAHNSHLKREIALAEMEELYAHNLAMNAMLRGTKELLRNSSVFMS